MAEKEPLLEPWTDHDRLSRLDAKMDTVIENLSKLTEATSTGNDDHEKRIRDLETKSTTMQASSATWRYGLATALTALGVAVGIIALLK